MYLGKNSIHSKDRFKAPKTRYKKKLVSKFLKMDMPWNLSLITDFAFDYLLSQIIVLCKWGIFNR